MLQLRNISKQYKTGELVQQALDNVSLDLRDSEFVAVLVLSGAMGIILALLLLIPINAVIVRLSECVEVTANLPLLYGTVLILISMTITIIGGLIPSKRVAKKDPVIALRTE